MSVHESNTRVHVDAGAAAAAVAVVVAELIRIFFVHLVSEYVKDDSITNESELTELFIKLCAIT